MVKIRTYKGILYIFQQVQKIFQKYVDDNILPMLLFKSPKGQHKQHSFFEKETYYYEYL